MKYDFKLASAQATTNVAIKSFRYCSDILMLFSYWVNIAIILHAHIIEK